MCVLDGIAVHVKQVYNLWHLAVGLRHIILIKCGSLRMVAVRAVYIAGVSWNSQSKLNYNHISISRNYES